MGLNAAPASAPCSWQGCGTHQLGHMQTLGGCIITEPAVSYPNIPYSILHFCCSPPRPQSQTGRDLRKGGNLFSPSPTPNIHKTPSPFSGQAQPWPPLQPCEPQIRWAKLLYHFQTLSADLPLPTMLLTLLSSTSQHVHLQGNSLKGHFGQRNVGSTETKSRCHKAPWVWNQSTALETIPMVLITHSHHLFQHWEPPSKE